MPGDQKYNLRVFTTTGELNKSAAEFIIALADKYVRDNGKFSLVLSGGNTPGHLYQLLAEEKYSVQMPWHVTHIFWGDERCLPLEDERNNSHVAKLSLLDKINIPEQNVHVMPVNMHPAEAATAYEKELDLFFNGQPWRFDLVLLGLGENGHTASLFPGTKAALDRTEGIRTVYVEEQQMFRVTMTAPLINAARNILFIVSGKNKSEILSAVLDGSAQRYPAQLIKPVNGKLYWFADESAAQLLHQ